MYWKGIFHYHTLVVLFCWFLFAAEKQLKFGQENLSNNVRSIIRKLKTCIYRIVERNAKTFKIITFRNVNIERIFNTDLV